MPKIFKKHFAAVHLNPATDLTKVLREYREDDQGDILSVAYKNEALDTELCIDTAVVEPSQAEPFFSSIFIGKEGIEEFRNAVPVTEHVSIKPETEVWKRVFDIVFSIVLMLLGFPVFAVIYVITKVSSPGPVFYRQERVGKDERPFHIYKFRSMYVDAEKFGPQLSNAHDPRITKWGRVIRRTRLDELPQFWNVLKGDMSVVGPRPERSYFIDRIVETNPEYKRLHRIRPGVTSLGQVYYGYAESVGEMCERMEYDLQYLQKPNIRADIQVILRTVKVMVQCKGK
ncbi:sugar transferase [Mucilaginibacter sp. CAU 1740]|uniref:sugar transferase n=1 Tax=Mucilaginibacter sp. CAU 1740 TaxID=3140365 RepID=UPI00325C309E